MEFVKFPKIHRLFKECVITEKIDGTNAQIAINEEGTVRAGSRNRWLTPESDNFGFAAWVESNKEELRELGPGRHYGEWWGAGIQRRYGLNHKRFSLFNTLRWGAKELPPVCCYVVPVLYEGPFDTAVVEEWIDNLRVDGSRAAPGFNRPEGLVVFHVPSQHVFKVILDKPAGPLS